MAPHSTWQIRAPRVALVADARGTLAQAIGGGRLLGVVILEASSLVAARMQASPAELGRGGVFHLWGHSWELQEAGQWQRLADVFRIMREFTGEAAAVTNAQVCQAVQGASTGGNLATQDGASSAPAA